MNAVDPAGIRIRACLAVVEGGRILLVPMYDTDSGPVQWSIPGGRLRIGESLAQAATREFEEETGLRAEVGELLCATEVILPERPYHSITLTFAGQVTGGSERPEPNHRYGTKAPRWLSAEELAGLEIHPRDAVDKALGLA